MGGEEREGKGKGKGRGERGGGKEEEGPPITPFLCSMANKETNLLLIW